MSYVEDIEVWLATRKLVCDPSYNFIASHLSTFYILSIVLGSLLIVPLADYVGRKTLNIALGICLFVILALGCLSRYIDALEDLRLIFVLTCLAVGLSAARALVSLIYTTEITTKDRLVRILCFCFFFLGFRLVISALHMKFSKFDYMSSILLNIIINVLSLPV